MALSHRRALAVDGVPSRQLDLTNTAAMRALFREVRPDSILHCAALTDVDWCEDHPDETHLVNVTATGVLAEVAAETGARLLYVSTDSVFDGRRGSYTEDDATAPVNVYARSKLAGETAVREGSAGDWLIVRTSIYGWSPHGRKSVAEWFLAGLATGRHVRGFADVTFTPILVEDLSEVMLDLISTHARGVFHVGGSEACTKFEFGRRVARTFGLSDENLVPVSVRDVVLRAPRPLDTSLATDRIASQLGHRMPTVDEGLTHFKELRSTYAQL